MTDTTLVLIALVGVTAVSAFLAGRFLTRNTAGVASGGGDISAIELARLQERERLLGSQIVTLEAQVQNLGNEACRWSDDAATLREKMAGSEERLTGLDRELGREKELNASAQLKLAAAFGDFAGEKDRLHAAMSDESRKRAEAERSEHELRGQIERAGSHISERDSTIQELRKRNDEVRAELAGRQSDLAAASERQLALQRTIAERDEQLQGLQERLKSEFENMANRILAATADQVSAKSHESLESILEPLRAQIAHFQQKVETTHSEDTKQRATMAEQIRQVASAGQSIGVQAENLANALKGDSQLRGRWGEVRLERILEQAGLERGREFVVQGGEFNLKGDDGESLRPDVIVLLPEHRHLIIDSKLSLVHYLEYESADDEDAQHIALKKLLASVRGHADSLAGKRYQASEGLNSHELVLMFIPIEGVAALVLKHDDELYAYCWGKRVVMVSPSTLFMTMQTVASVWRYERKNENADLIAQQAGQLYDKLAGLVGDLNQVSQKIQSAAEAHAEAVRKLSTGKGNALSRAQKLKALGVTPKNDFPVVMLGGERQTVTADDDDGPVSLLEIATPKLLEKAVSVA